MRSTDIKHLYNTYLRISRKRQNKPYRLRTNWTGFEESEYYVPLLKLKNFFDRNYTVNIEDFFISPYEVYEEEAYYDLDFYNSMSAVKVYSIYCSKKNQMDVDSDIQIDSILRGLKFIEKFCVSRSIKLTEYLNYFESNATINSFLVHLKEKNISIYNLFPFKEFDKTISKIDFNSLKFILNDLPSKISIYRSKFLYSKKGKVLATKGLKLIEQSICKKLS